MKEKKDIKENQVEREYVIPLREKCRPVPRYKKTNKAVKTVKEFLARHMKIRDRDLKKIKLDIYLNEALWFRGIKNPPHKIKVKAVKEGDIVRVYALDLPKNIKFKKKREKRKDESQEKIAKKIKEGKKSIMEKAKEGLHTTKEKGTSDNLKEDKKEELKNKDNLEKEVEKEKSVESSDEKSNREAKVKDKHLSDIKSQKQSKNIRIGYNQTSRGH